jgi:hypothetical protein
MMTIYQDIVDNPKFPPAFSVRFKDFMRAREEGARQRKRQKQQEKISGEQYAESWRLRV